MTTILPPRSDFYRLSALPIGALTLLVACCTRLLLIAMNDSY